MVAQKVVAISQARRSSTRLREKILLPVLGQPLLKHHLDRLSQARCISEYYVATTTADEDQLIADLCREWRVPCFRGDMDDVLSRYALVVAATEPDVVIRVTSDCPMLDPDVIDQMYEVFAEENYDYVGLDRGAFPHGLDCEIMTRAAFDAAAREATNPFEREHVTAFIYHHPDRFKIGMLTQEGDYAAYRWTVDYPEDFTLVKAILEQVLPVNPAYGWRDVVDLLQGEPELMALNIDAEQRWHARLDQQRKASGISL